MSAIHIEALRRNYDATKAERDTLAKAYEKSGCMTAGIPNLQQFDWKLERLAKELADVGINVEAAVCNPCVADARDVLHEQAAPKVQQRPMVRPRRAVQRQSEG